MTHLKKCSLLETLISRGDQIDIINGKLIITPSSKLDVPKQWLALNRHNLVIAIVKLFDTDVYIFDSYTTGYYGKNKSAGVTLQFVSLTTGKQCYVTFNVELKRKRTTVKATKGSSLPKGQFRVSKKYMFCKFWLATGLNLPPRLSAFHDYMGNLKQLYFLPRVGQQNKVIDKIIPTLNINNKDILNKFINNNAYNCQTRNTQKPLNNHSITTRKDLAESTLNKGGPVNTTTGLNNYELSKQGSAVISNHSSITPMNKSPEEQTIEEWFTDYNKA